MTADPYRTALRAVATTVLAVLAALLFSAGPASAHAELESSNPADGASLGAAPSRVDLTFGEAPEANLATITVVGPDGRHYEQGNATVNDRVMSVGVAALGPAGDYRIGYRALSDDGHPVTGRLTFTMTTGSPVVAAASPSPVAAGQDLGAQDAGAQDAGAQDHGGHGGSSGVPAWPFLVVGVIVVVGAGAYIARRR